MKYALLIYNPTPGTDAPPEQERRATNDRTAEILQRPYIDSWLIVRDTETAVNVTGGGSDVISADGPFLPNEEYIGGFIVLEADSIAAAQAVAAELQETRHEGAIEVREVLGP